MLLFALLNLSMAFFPEKGVSFLGLSVEFPTLTEFYALEKKSIKVDNKEKELEKLLEKLRQDSIDIDQQIKKELRDSIENAWKKLQYPNNDKTVLYEFFSELENARNKKVRIMHFGDSQIEADRITSFVRNELQKKFGGYGAGLFAIEQVTRKMSVKQIHSSNWERYAGFGRKKDTLKKIC